ncbi:hypothetical protein E2F50_00460 [Rhizobium deserti]|uniref:Uncharacterized protein n=1 Tax=Rhizobium deserti TaxID=2547961 RepID=A0A4R5ULG7_9HYPH|nr:hypothetical protein [Rhizobium deserti]TDK38665.1 hypothetical protein E2F50_00460 [Rhizobium deserti]
MLRRSLRNALILFFVLPLAAFRMPSSDGSRQGLIYDVRGAFVTAKPDVPRALVTEVDSLVDVAVRATIRSSILPRTILCVRLSNVSGTAVLFGMRHSAKVTVQAVSVASGEPVAEGSFTTSVFVFDRTAADRALAEKVAARIAGEFRLDAGAHGSLASAFAK